MWIPKQNLEKHWVVLLKYCNKVSVAIIKIYHTTQTPKDNTGEKGEIQASWRIDCMLCLVKQISNSIHGFQH